MLDKISYRIKAVLAAIRGKEFDFAIAEIEKWLNGKNENQKITDAIYGSDVEVWLTQYPYKEHCLRGEEAE